MTFSPPLKVMIVDDSVVVRGLLRNIIQAETDMTIVATCPDGESALHNYKTHLPDIVLLDIEMPVMDGLSALKQMMTFSPPARVIMCSSLTQKGAAATVEALKAGAVDCLSKPTSSSIDRGEDFSRELIRKLRSIGRRHGDAVSASVPAAADAPVSAAADNFTLRPFPATWPRAFPLALAIGSSTGGPRALSEFLSGLDKNILLPIFITQHIPAGFGSYLAESLQKSTGFPVHEAAENMIVEPGHVYVAPGQMHMGLKPGVPRRIALIDTPPVNFCKPSIDVMLDSLTEAYGGYILSIFLTGMGADGHPASRRMILQGQGNILLAQDKESSIIWGIPGAVAKDNLCHAVLPVPALAELTNKLIRREIVTNAG